MTVVAFEAEVRAFCDRVANTFLNGDLGLLTEFYTYPVAVYLPGGMRIEMTPQETERTVFERRIHALSIGVTAVSAEVHEIGPVRAERFPVRVDWHFNDGKGRTLATSRMRYFCETTSEAGIRIAMLEFVQLAFERQFPASGDDGPAH